MNSKSNIKTLDKTKRDNNIPDKPIYKSGFLPNLSTKTNATKVIKKLIKPIKIVINKAS